MSDELADLLPEAVRFHCQICNRFKTGTSEDLDRYIKHDSQWPICCGARMSVILSDGPTKSPERSSR
ncbi:hypothetical protein [Singulisphaera sp. PoT]|uniref:hypothetical protein n=1 Tax=Singulisphaera sp. PoT TaxID=3411797 RepID=UPI003BF4B616